MSRLPVNPFRVAFVHPVLIVFLHSNMYVFPGIGLGAVASRAKTITAEMLYVAALELSSSVSEELLSQGRVFPPLSQIREVSLRIATGVAKEAEAAGLARQFPADDEVSCSCWIVCGTERWELESV